MEYTKIIELYWQRKLYRMRSSLKRHMEKEGVAIQ